MIKKSLPKVLLFTLFFYIIFAQVNSNCQTIKAKGVYYIPDIEVIFGQGVNEYQAKKYERAKDTFSELLNSYPAHQRITAVYIMLGKCYYKLGTDKKALSLLNQLITKYPNTNYLDDAHYTMGFCYYRKGQYFNALNEFLFVADNNNKQKLVEKSRNLAIKIIDNNLTLIEIKRLREKVTGKISIAILTIKLAQRYLNLGKREAAISLLQSFIKQHPENPYISYVRNYSGIQIYH